MAAPSDYSGRLEKLANLKWMGSRWEKKEKYSCVPT